MMRGKVGQGSVGLANVSGEPLSVDAVLEAVHHPSAGGVASFLGVVRDEDGGRHVAALEYSGHDSAAEVLRRLAERVATREGVVRVAVTHRVGRLGIGDLALVAAVSAGHRGEAFAACRDLVDELKATVPIWKHQIFADGSQEWVGMP